MNENQLSATEHWVLERLNAGDEVGLFSYARSHSHDPIENGQKLSGDFLAKLLTNNFANFHPPNNRVRIISAIIDDQVNLTNAHIPFDVELSHCIFRSIVFLSRATFDHNASFIGSHFKADTMLYDANVQGDLVLTDTEFQDMTNLHLARVAGSLSLRNAKFHGDRSFLVLEGVKVNKNLYLNNATFDKAVLFSGMEIGGELIAHNTHFISSQPADFSKIKVTRSASFGESDIRGGLDLSLSQFDVLDLSAIQYERQSSFDFRGMTYRHIKADYSELQSPTKLLEFVKRSPYSWDVYNSLEMFFVREGNRSDANQAFIAGKRRERRERLSGLAWFGSLVVDTLSGYGRHTERIGFLCLGIVGLGCLLFPLDKMEPLDSEELKKPPIKRRAYNRFWYSLGLFLPFVNLQTAEAWKPKKKHTVLRNYVRIHILLGWIFVPILLAALSGLIK